MKGICVRSEIKPLKKVLLHRPGRELLHLTPDRLPELLFDDIPFLKVAQQEHDAFAQILRSNGTEVVYLEDLMAEVLKLHPEQTKPFLYQWLLPSAKSTSLVRGRLSKAPATAGTPLKTAPSKRELSAAKLLTEGVLSLYAKKHHPAGWCFCVIQI